MDETEKFNLKLAENARNSGIKLCKDCEHCAWDPLMNGHFSKCRVCSLGIDKVSGLVQDNLLCHLARMYASSELHRCGPEAKYFKQKETPKVEPVVETKPEPTPVPEKPTPEKKTPSFLKKAVDFLRTW